MSKTCPNCGSPIEPYKHKCDYCGTWYFDLTAFDVEDRKPCYVKFKTLYGTITALAVPEVQALEIYTDTVEAYSNGVVVQNFNTDQHCDINVAFHLLESGNRLFTLEVNNNKIYDPHVHGKHDICGTTELDCCYCSPCCDHRKSVEEINNR